MVSGHTIIESNSQIRYRDRDFPVLNVQLARLGIVPPGTVNRRGPRTTYSTQPFTSVWLPLLENCKP
jgi:hypothetical protein